jgi:hypothetical protein
MPTVLNGLLLLVPTRGRPHAVRDFSQSFCLSVEDTSSAALVFVVDCDDPTLPEYAATGLPLFVSHADSGMVGALNEAASMLLPESGLDVVAFAGDDHRIRTRGWDRQFLSVLGEMGSGWVYGNDLHQGAALPTAVAMTADIPATLGWMAPPCLRHLYVDNAWLDMGTALGRIQYLPDVVIEHMHPTAGKGTADTNYERVNSPSSYGRDSAAYARYKQAGMGDDLDRLRAVLS